MNVMNQGYAMPKPVGGFSELYKCFRFLHPYEEVGQKTWEELENSILFHADSYMLKLKDQYIINSRDAGTPCSKPHPSIWICIFMSIGGKLKCCKYLTRDIVKLDIDRKGFRVGGQVLEEKIDGLLVVIQDIFSRTILFDEPGSYIIDPTLPHVRSYIKVLCGPDRDVNISFSDAKALNPRAFKLSMWIVAGEKIDVRMSGQLKSFMDGMTPIDVMDMLDETRYLPTHEYGNEMKVNHIKAGVLDMFLHAYQDVGLMNDTLVFQWSGVTPFRFEDDDMLMKVSTAKDVCFKFH